MMEVEKYYFNNYMIIAFCCLHEYYVIALIYHMRKTKRKDRGNALHRNVKIFQKFKFINKKLKYVYIYIKKMLQTYIY